MEAHIGRRLHQMRFAACVAELATRPYPPMWPIAHGRPVRPDILMTTWYEFTGDLRPRVISYTMVKGHPIQVTIEETAPDRTWIHHYFVFVSMGAGAVPRIQHALSRPIPDYDQAILRAAARGLLNPSPG